MAAQQNGALSWQKVSSKGDLYNTETVIGFIRIFIITEAMCVLIRETIYKYGRREKIKQNKNKQRNTVV